MENIDKTLEKRGEIYGDFVVNATLSQTMKRVLRPYMLGMSYDKAESIDNILQKIARIVSGSFCNAKSGENYSDSWRDIAGYAMLIVSELNKQEKSESVKNENKVQSTKYSKATIIKAQKKKPKTIC